MDLLHRWSSMREKGKEREAADQQAESLLQEIQEAQQDWVNATRHFEYAEGQDQIDYAIFAIEAAEKRYEMLLRHAKRLSVAKPGFKSSEAG
ncbi:DUF2508 family protein [Paenibacillus sp. 1P07SE]|uniref:DUF2508 family protein n=1 Tax=Paenibacillus sp. 1P07SE TaxID=3132209 RepID=UPI0039A6490D